MKKVAIHQPQYFPWLGLLHKISQADLFVFLDNVKFSKGSYQNRAVYSTKTGGKYLTIPVYSKDHQNSDLQIKDIIFAYNQDTILKRNFETLRHRYSKSKGWKSISEQLEKMMIYTTYESVCDYIIESMYFTLDLFNVQTVCLKASELEVKGKKDDLVLDIVKKVNGDIYLSGQGAKAYMREEIFYDENIKIEYQDFHHPLYNQGDGFEFVEGCMALDFYLSDPQEAIKYAEAKLIKNI